MKKVLSVITVLVALLCMLAACGTMTRQGVTDSTTLPNEKTLSIVCTVFPQYDWTKAILGDRVNEVSLTMLLDTGTDLHSYQPKANDIMKIGDSDLFVYVGGESDKWVPDALKTAQTEINALNLMEALGTAAKLESEEGIIEEHDHDQEEAEEYDHDHNEDHEHEEEYDEHIWLSLKNAVILCTAITEKLCALDPEYADTYRANNAAYCEKLGALDKRFADFVSTAKYDTIVCADRFPFMYLCEDYGLKYFAAFSGCSAESEASFKTVVSLAEKVDELELKVVFQTENPLADIAKTVVNTTAGKNQKILSLDSMQSVTAEKIAAGEDYYFAMEKNINTLMEGLEG